MAACGGEKKVLDLLELRLTDSCESPDLGAESQTLGPLKEQCDGLSVASSRVSRFKYMTPSW